MASNDEPSVTEERLEQFANAVLSIIVTLLGITSSVILEQYWKALYPILVRLFPSVNAVKLEHLAKEESAISFTESGITMFVIPEQ